MDTYGMLGPLRDLAIAGTLELPEAANKAAEIWRDEPIDDARFSGDAWSSSPYFRALARTYLMVEDWIGRSCDRVEGSWQHQARARYLAAILAAGLSPANYLLTNPVALRAAADTGGRSLREGSLNMVRDLARGGMPLTVDRAQFPVGKVLARTPGSVIYRNELFELLQYTPAGSRVRAIPLLMIPPQLNRHYVLDLAEGRSLVEYARSFGMQVFMVVWRNPRADLGHGRWGLDDYLDAEQEAAAVVRRVTGADTLNWLGLCAGGTTLALHLARQAAAKKTPAASATFLVTMVNNAVPNIVGTFDTPGMRAQLSAMADAGQVLPASSLRTAFAWLRPNDLVFNYLVTGWLKGEDPPPFDVLAWNDDATGVTARFTLDSTRMLCDGAGVDFGAVDCDSFHIAGYTDHIVPWRAVYDGMSKFGGSKEVAVVRSGHIQSFVNPAESTRHGYWSGGPSGSDPDEWMASASWTGESWWPRWREWLLERSGQPIPAPKEQGSKKYPPLAPAPGSYAVG